jgi:hypothetical protein
MLKTTNVIVDPKLVVWSIVMNISRKADRNLFETSVETSLSHLTTAKYFQFTKKAELTQLK